MGGSSLKTARVRPSVHLTKLKSRSKQNISKQINQKYKESLDHKIFIISKILLAFFLNFHCCINIMPVVKNRNRNPGLWKGDCV